MMLKELRVTVVLLATLVLLGFIHYQAGGSTGDLWMADGVILAGVSACLVGRSFTTGGMEGIVKAWNGAKK